MELGLKAHMAKNYYHILGVASNATQDQIRSAYRREAKRLHPDHTGGGCEPFRDVQEAYEVLGDPLRRRTYDDEVAREKRCTARGIEPEPLTRRGSPVEPLVPRWRSTDPWDRFFATPFHFLLDEVFDRAWRDLDIPAQAGSGRTEEIQFEVSLTQQKARQGGRIRVLVPVQLRCPACRGRGGAGFFECLQCLGSGLVAGEVPVELTFPAGVVDRSTGRVALRRPGMRDLALTLHFRVQEW